MAVAATDSNVKRVEKEKSKRVALYEEEKKQAQVKAAESVLDAVLDAVAEAA